MSFLQFQKTLHALNGATDNAILALSDEWERKRSGLLIQLRDLPELVLAFKARARRVSETMPGLTLIDAAPGIRLANTIEGSANALYSLAEIVAIFANRITGGRLPRNFNRLRKQVDGNRCSDPRLPEALGDLQWYRKVRELRTEWAHFSTIFIGLDGDEPVVVARSHRDKLDRVEFTENAIFKVDSYVDWLRNAIRGLDQFGFYLLRRYLLPTLDLDRIIPAFRRADQPFPEIREGRLVVRHETIGALLREFGIDPSLAIHD